MSSFFYVWNFGKYCSNTPNIVRRSTEWFLHLRKKLSGDSRAAWQEHCGDGVICIDKLWSFEYERLTLIWVKYLLPSLLPKAKNLYLCGSKCFFNAVLNSVMSWNFVMSLGICSYFLVNNTNYEWENLTFPLGKERNFLWFLVLWPVDGAMMGMQDEMRGHWYCLVKKGYS